MSKTPSPLFYTAAMAAKALGLSLRYFQRLAVATRCPAAVFKCKTGRDRHFWTASDIEQIRQYHTTIQIKPKLR